MKLHYFLPIIALFFAFLYFSGYNSAPNDFILNESSIDLTEKGVFLYFSIVFSVEWLIYIAINPILYSKKLQWLHFLTSLLAFPIAFYAYNYLPASVAIAIRLLNSF